MKQKIKANKILMIAIIGDNRHLINFSGDDETQVELIMGLHEVEHNHHKHHNVASNYSIIQQLFEEVEYCYDRFMCR